MARVIPPEVRQAMLKGDYETLKQMGRNGNRILRWKKERRMARLERGAIIFARRTPGAGD